MALGAASMTGAIASGIISTLTKKYQKKLNLIDIVTRATVVFDRVISAALKNGIIDEEEFNTLQTLHLETLNELTGVDRRMEAENRILSRKRSDGRNKRTKKKQKQKLNCLLAVLFCMLL